MRQKLVRFGTRPPEEVMREKRAVISACQLRVYKWAGVDLNHRHTDFQSIIRLVSVVLTDSYIAFLGVK